MEVSNQFSLNKTDLWKILKGAAIAMGGAGLVYLASALDTLKLGSDTPIWVAVASIIVNIGVHWVQGRAK